MKILSTKTLAELKVVLQNPEASGPDPVYQVYALDDDPKWVNQTVLATGRLGREYPKTFGHYHGTAADETYHLVEGEGVFVLQSKFFQGSEWIPNRVREVFLIKAKPSDEITITPEWGHSWSNIGSEDLVTVDNWQAGHSPTDYQVIEQLHGMAYYLIDQDGKPTPVANPNYQNLPEPRWVTAEEFKNLT